MSTAELEDYRAQAAAWFAENLPEPPGFFVPESFLEVSTPEQFAFLRDWQAKVYEAGYLGAAWPEAYGGRGLAQAYQDIATEEMIRARAPIMVNAIGLNWAGPVILDMGSQEDKRRYIKGILTGEDIWCQGFSEPDHGSDLGSAQLKAVREGDDYVLNGSKIWTTLGSFSKYMILLARTNPEAENRYKGLSFFLAPTTVPGVETRPVRKLTGEYGFTQTFFTDARIPASCRLGAEGEGWLVAMRILEYERGARGGQAGGWIMTEPDIDDVVALAREAKRDGRPAIEDPVLRDRLVSLMIEAQGVKLSRQREHVAPLNAERPWSLSLCAKLTFSEHALALHALAVTLQGERAAYYHGEPNALDGGRWPRGYLNAFGATIGGGTSQVQRNIIAEHVLGLPKR